MKVARYQILWFGPPPNDRTVLEIVNRELEIVQAPSGAIDDAMFARATAAVFHFAGKEIGAVRELAAGHVKRAMDHGLLVYLLAENDAVQGYVQNWTGDYFGDKAPTVSPVFKTLPEPHALAELLARHDPGRTALSQPTIRPDGAVDGLEASDRLLLCRSFSDCTSLHLTPLIPGRTATVFMVQATFRDSLAGPRPLPFFIKIGAAGKIQREISLYGIYATHFIPFHLRPNLDPTRCLVSHARGILVGNFVERSDSLADLAFRGQANGAIHSLFDVTLGGWRAQAFADEHATKQGPVAGALKDLFDFRRVKPAYIELARTFGVDTSPQGLWERLIGLQGQCYRLAPMHGDLHGENVRVRHNDAILIDLASINPGPLAADPASLETSLVFETPRGARLPADDSAWEAMVDEFYGPSAFRILPPPRFEGDPFAATWNSARQVRSIALPSQACDGEYAAAVAVYLLRRTMFAGDGPLDRKRRGYAYVTAARLIGQLSK